MKTVGELVESAFLAGYLAGIEAYAWWKDGQQFVGSTGTRLAAAQKSHAEDALPYFHRFLDFEKKMAKEYGVEDADAD